MQYRIDTFIKSTIFILLGLLFAQIFVHGGNYLITLPTHNRPLSLVIYYIISFFIAGGFLWKGYILLWIAITAKPRALPIGSRIMVYSDSRKDHCVDHGEVLYLRGDYITYRSFRGISGYSKIAHKSIVTRMGKHGTT